MTTSKPDPYWLSLLRREAAQTSIGRAALRVGISRTAVSQALADKYPGSSANLERKVLAALATPKVVSCPYAGVNLPGSMCEELSSRKAPTHNPVAMNWWRACQACEHRCDSEAQR